ncbi:MAG: T9SS type A sorting domain-containing protein [Saprospiraceae bacterium]
MSRLLPLLWCLLMSISLPAQSCPACEIAIPDNLPLDTVFLSTAATGQVGVAYDSDISFRLPVTTTPVANETTPAGLTINQFEITGIANLPPGLEWTPSQTVFDPAELNDGCAKICGTPLIAGEYIVQVSLLATVLVIEAETILEVPIIIAPRQSTTDGFTLRNGTGCGSTLVSFRNNVPSNGNDGFSYQWNFGNGQMTDRENPLDVEYAEAGEYTVDYQAVVDTTGFFLTEVFIDAVECDDFLGRPDLQVKIFDTLGVEVFASQALENVEPPLSIPTNFKIEAATYNLVVLDLDGGLLGGGDDDICGEFILRPADTGIYADMTDEATIRLNILHPTDTIRSQDTIVVYPIPASPQIEVVGDLIFCEGDSVLLTASYAENVQWYLDSTFLINQNQADLMIQTAGNYYVEYTSPDGCSSISDTLSVMVNENPPLVEFDVENNLLMVEDTSILMLETTWQWYLDDEIISDDAEFCLAEDGVYGLELTNAAGCKTLFERAVVYDENFPNCVSDVVDIANLGLNFNLYPNPVNDVLNIELDLIERSDIQLVVFNSVGQVIKEFYQKGATFLFQKTLNTNDLATGIYFLKIRVGERESMVKFVKK